MTTNTIIDGLLLILISINIGLTVRSLIGQAAIEARLDAHIRYTENGGKK